MNLGCGFMAIITADYYKSSIFLLFSLVLMFWMVLQPENCRPKANWAKNWIRWPTLISFGVAPAYLYYLLSPVQGWAAMVPPLIMVLASAWRLAKFNLLPPSLFFRPAYSCNRYVFLLDFSWV